jgi:hypothetical protein
MRKSTFCPVICSGRTTSLALECGGGLAALGGIFLFARSPLVLSIYARQQREKERSRLKPVARVGA